MGLDGCDGVQGAWGGTETMHAETIMVMQALILGPMAGEISPDIMFFKVWRIWVFMGVGGCIWVLVGALGSRDTGGTKNKRKKSKNGRVMVIFRCMSG